MLFSTVGDAECKYILLKHKNVQINHYSGDNVILVTCSKVKS